jgi:hypothetical protein
MKILRTHQPSVPLRRKIVIAPPLLPSMNMGSCDYLIQLNNFKKAMASANLLQPIIHN